MTRLFVAHKYRRHWTRFTQARNFAILELRTVNSATALGAALVPRSATASWAAMYDTLWRSDINISTASRYDLVRASASPADLQIMWAIWAVLSFIAAAVTGTVFVAVIASQSARSAAFSLYVATLMLPDFLYAICCLITCILNHMNHGYVGAAHCEWQSIYLTFGSLASTWMNAVVAREVYTLVSKTARLETYVPRTPRTVLLQAAGVYTYAAVMASLTTWGVFPHQANVQGGMVCIPTEYSLAATLFGWLVFIPLAFGLPTNYIVFVAFRIWRDGLMGWSTRSATVSAAGTASSRAHVKQTRILSLYFARIAVVLFVFRLPAITLLCALDMKSVWFAWSALTWVHLQGTVSAAMMLTKPDILLAVLGLFKCRTLDTEANAIFSRLIGGFSSAVGRNSSQGHPSARVDVENPSASLKRGGAKEVTKSSSAETDIVTELQRLESDVDLDGVEQATPDV